MIENSDRPELTSLDGKRFLFITRKWPPAVGGMEIYSSELAAALLDEGHVAAVPGEAMGLASSEPAVLRTIAPGVLWVAALLAVLLGQHRLFESDMADGSAWYGLSSSRMKSMMACMAAR